MGEHFILLFMKYIILQLIRKRKIKRIGVIAACRTIYWHDNCGLFYKGNNSLLELRENKL